MTPDETDGTQHFDSTQARARLEHDKDRVSELIASLRSEGLDQEEADQSGELTHYDQHPADTASDTFEREKDLSILERLEDELAEIEAALQRIDDGTYGIDEVTGEPIDPERLNALPTARTNTATNADTAIPRPAGDGGWSGPGDARPL